MLFNCVVMADGRVQPLLFDRGSPELRVTADGIEGGSLLILPDTDSELVIEWKPAWAWFSYADEGVHLLPTLVSNEGKKLTDGLPMSRFCQEQQKQNRQSAFHEYGSPLVEMGISLQTVVHSPG